MTLTIFDNSPGPHVHALVIGIGGYEHLKGGTGRKLPNMMQYGNLGQLTSAPRSAVEIARGLTLPQLEWVVPLGSIEVLLSPAPEDPDPSGDGLIKDLATRDGIQQAFDAWWDRCDADTGNVALFYVAGHGLAGLHSVVLASDFGRYPNQPWAQAFDVEDTRRALTANRAATQIFLVDACREVTTSNVEVPNAPAPALRAPTMRQPDNCLHDLTIMATSRTLKAYGPTKKPSYFASAITAGLAGGAGLKADGCWWISTGKLAERIYTLIELAGADITAQRPIPTAVSTLRLARFDGTPSAKLGLACLPSEATLLADLAWRQGSHPDRCRPQRLATEWIVDLNPGLYLVSATFANGEYTNQTQDVIVEPPMTRERIVVR